MVSDIPLESAQRVATEIVGVGYEARALRHDTTSPEDNRDVVRLAVETFGSFDLAFNNAGIGGNLDATVDDARSDNIANWWRTIEVNLNEVRRPGGCHKGHQSEWRETVMLTRPATRR